MLQWQRNPLMDMLGIDVPIVQAPIGSPCSVELVLASSAAGALGVLPVTWDTDAHLEERVAALTRGRSDRVAVNLVLEWPFERKLRYCLDAGIRIVSTFWGPPGDVTPLVHGAGAVHVHTVGSVDEAKRAADCGVDVIVAQGWEAGGHVRGSTGLLALVPEVVDAVSPVPVLAAGGISDGRGLAAALTLGAQGAWVGSAFLLATEAATQDAYRAAVRRSTADDTVHGIVFDKGWPDAPHRMIRNQTVRDWETAGRPVGEERPGSHDVIATSADGTPIERYADVAPTRGATGLTGEMALYAGQGVGQIAVEASAARIVERMSSQALEVLSQARTSGAR